MFILYWGSLDICDVGTWGSPPRQPDQQTHPIWTTNYHLKWKGRGEQHPTSSSLKNRNHTAARSPKEAGNAVHVCNPRRAPLFIIKKVSLHHDSGHGSPVEGKLHSAITGAGISMNSIPD